MAAEIGLPQLKKNRAHEVCGPAAVPFALMMAARAAGTIMFIDGVNSPDQLYPAGVGCIVDMARILVARGKSHTDRLWIAEETLRSGCVPVVIVRIVKNIDLTSGRRLQLAAEAGNSLGLLIVPEGMGSNAAESRWRCIPLGDEGDTHEARQLDSTHFQMTCIKNKSGTFGSWVVCWNEAARHIDCLSQTGDGSISQAVFG